MRSYYKFVVLALAVALVVPAGLWGQASSTGAITGLVQDQNGGSVPGATVTVINKATGTKQREVTTTEAGTFNVPLLPPGIYSVEMTASGFAKYVAETVVVRVTETTKLVVTLKLGAVTETVTVTEAATPSPINLTSAATGQTIVSQTVSNLPLSTGNFLTLLTLSSGANTELFDNAALGRGQVTITVNGQRAANNNYQLEGIGANDYNLPILDNVPLPNPRTIEEFKAQTSLYDASQGRNGGGNTQVTLKSGTNAYHGDAFEFFRNNVLNANDWFRNAATPQQPRPVLRQNQFGGSFGGPVPLIKDLFFFLNYQGTRAASGISAGTFFNNQIVILPATRDAATLASTFLAGTGFTASNIDPVALKFLNLPASKCPIFNDGKFCIPSLPGTAGIASNGKVNRASLTRSGLGTFQDDQYVVSVDKQVTSKDRFTGRWFFSNNAILQPFGTGTGSGALPFARSIPGSNRFLKLGWTRTFTSSIVNDFRYGFSRFTFARVPGEPISLTDIGATRGNSATVPAAYQLKVIGALLLGTGVNDVRSGAFNTFIWGDDVSITRGRHLFRMGMEITRYQLNRSNPFAQRGQVTFGPTATLNGFQNFLIGNITNTFAGAGFSSFHFRDTDAAAYFQDDWKFTRRLTVNLGIRWEGLGVAHEVKDLLTNFRGLQDGTAGVISTIHPQNAPRVGTPGVSRCTLLNCFTKRNFAPRAGFAWDMFGNQRTVLRGGYGIYYQRSSNQVLLQSAVVGPPFNTQISVQNPGTTPANPFPSIPPESAFPLPNDLVIPPLVAFNSTTGAPIFGTDPSCGPSSSPGVCGPSTINPTVAVRDFKPPYSQAFNLTLQREFIKGWVLELGYVATKGNRLITGSPLNPGQICTSASPCVIPASIGRNVTVVSGTPFVTQRSDGSIQITGSTLANVDARVPVQFLGLSNSNGDFTAQQGNSIYHSLQATVSHQWANGLYLQGAYTYSKSIDNSSGSSFVDELTGSGAYGNFLSLSSNRARSDFDRTHRLVVSYNYELPFARWAHIENHGFGKIVNGWSINGVTTFQSGTPFSVIDTSAPNLLDPFNVNNNNLGEADTFGNLATLAPGATLASATRSGSVQSHVGDFLNIGAFLIGGNCVNNQNIVVPCTIGSPPVANPAAVASAVGNVGRNSFRGPFQQNWDMAIVKTTRITERVGVDFRAEFFNIFNHPSFQSPQAQGNTLGNYGVVDVGTGKGASAILATVSRPRIIQFALLFHF